MQAPKNGFFYVIDRESGEFINAEAFIPVTWATGIDPETGRPVEVPGARYKDAPFLNIPSGFGAHNWHPMAFSPLHELVYLPAQELPAVYMNDAELEFAEGFWNGGIDFETLHMPDDPEVKAQIGAMVRGALIAWDPVAQREVWRYQHAGPWNGGTLATAGNLVFQGSLIGEFAAYAADSGERLWQFDAQTGVAAAPISYAVGGQQHIAVAAGWGTVFALFGGEASAAMGMKNFSRILAFRLGGGESLPPKPESMIVAIPEPPAIETNAAQLASGKDLYYERCVVCHGMNVAGGGVLPDLRYSTADTHAAWDAIVLGGSLRDNGMPAFGGILSKADSDAMHAFVIDESRRAYERSRNN